MVTNRNSCLLLDRYSKVQIIFNLAQIHLLRFSTIKHIVSSATSIHQLMWSLSRKEKHNTCFTYSYLAKESNDLVSICLDFYALRDTHSMKRKFKQWWLTLTDHNKKTTTYDIGNSVSVLDRHTQIWRG